MMTILSMWKFKTISLVSVFKKGQQFFSFSTFFFNVLWWQRNDIFFHWKSKLVTLTCCDQFIIFSFLIYHFSNKQTTERNEKNLLSFVFVRIQFFPLNHPNDDNLLFPQFLLHSLSIYLSLTFTILPQKELQHK